MDWLKSRIKEPTTWAGVVSFTAYVIMYFTPDNIDQEVVTIRDLILHSIAGLAFITSVMTKEKK